MLEKIDELLAGVDDTIDDFDTEFEEVKPAKEKQAIQEIVLYLDDEQFERYKKWVNALAEEMKCNLTEATYNAVKYTFDELGL